MHTLLRRCPRLSYVTCGLLQQPAGWVYKLNDQQATTNPECSGATHFRYLQVRPGSIISAAQRSALAQRSRVYQLQTECCFASY